jgi:hypothetical protein
MGDKISAIRCSLSAGAASTNRLSPRPMQGTGPVISVKVATQNEVASLKKVFYLFCDHIVRVNWLN